MGVFESELVQTLTWEVQLFLNVLLDRWYGDGSENLAVRVSEIYEQANAVRDLAEPLERIVDTLVKIGLLKRRGAHVEPARSLHYDALRRDFVLGART